MRTGDSTEAQLDPLTREIALRVGRKQRHVAEHHAGTPTMDIELGP